VEKKFTRREVLGVGLGAAALVTSGAAIASAQPSKNSSKVAKNNSSKVDTFNEYGNDLETGLLLRTSPIAVKMLEKEADIPEGAFRPKRDGGYHLAQCQAFSLSRMEGKTVAMLKEDHWCPTALTAYGMVEKSGAMAGFGESYMSFETGKYVGIVTAPLKSATFMPDVVMVYLNPAQLRGTLLPLTFGGGSSEVSTQLFLPSCGHAVVDPMKTGKYTVVLPDPGEYQRALAREDEIILAIPQQKMDALMASLKQGGKMYSHREQHMSLKPDFERPQFYKDMFKSWGLDSE